MQLIIVILIILFIVLFFKTLFSFKLPLGTLTALTGGLGSSKTTNLAKALIKLYRKSLLNYYLFRWNIGLLPWNNKKQYDADGNVIYEYNVYDPYEVYTNFPLILRYNKNPKKILYSNALTREHITCEYAIKEHSLVGVDEAGTFFPFQSKRSNPDLIWDLTYFRHYTDSKMIVACQSLGNVDIAFRRVVNVVYNLNNYNKLPFRFYSVEVNKLYYNEDMNVVNVNNMNENKSLKMWGRHFKHKRFDSRYMSKFYKPKKICDYRFTSLKLDPDNQFYSKEKFKKMFYQDK